MNAPEYLNQVLQEGQQKANSIALETWQEVVLKIGTIPSNVIKDEMLRNKN